MCVHVEPQSLLGTELNELDLQVLGVSASNTLLQEPAWPGEGGDERLGVRDGEGEDVESTRKMTVSPPPRS